MFSGIEGVLLHTNVLQPHLSALLSWTIANNRRKIASAPKASQISCLMNLLACKPEDRIVFYRDLKPDRYVTVELLERFLAAASEPSPDVPEHRRTALIDNARDAVEATRAFRNAVVRKYLSLCRQEVSKHRQNAAIPISQSDAEQNMVQAIIIALDKFDSEKGALTSYIKHWLKFLMQSPGFVHEVGLAYDIPHSYRKQVSGAGNSNTGRKLTDKNLTFHLEQQQASSVAEESDAEIEMVRCLVQKADKTGILRLTTGISEYVPGLLTYYGVNTTNAAGEKQ